MTKTTTPRGRAWWALVLLPLIVAVVAVAWWQLRRPDPPVTAPNADNAAASDGNVTGAGSSTVVADERGYVTSRACLKCHAAEHASWHASYHRTMTQPATPEAITAPIDGTHLEAYGRSYDFERKGDKFFVTMVSPDWEQSIVAAGGDLSKIDTPRREQREIVQVTGSHHMQTFWTRGENGLRQVPWYWHREEKCWIPSEDSFLRPPDAGRMFEVWDAVCIKCHAVAGIPGFNLRRRFDSKIVEMGIACEACHGPGGKHVAHQERLAAGGGDPRDAAGNDETIVHPGRQTHEVASQICAQCHSTTRPRDKKEWLTQGSSYRPGGDFHKHLREVSFKTAQPEDEYYIRDGYWADGTCRTGGDEHLGLIESACYSRGKLSCLSCHSLHNYADRDDQLKPGMEGNGACLQCHAEYKEGLAEHTHHAAGSSGSLCYNCHMPHITYALFKGIRSHRIDSPSAAASARTGRPNACNLCHLDKTLEWTEQRLADWYGPADAPLALSDEDQEIAAAVRWLLEGDAAQRAIAAWHFGWQPAQQASGNDWPAAVLAHSLDDPYSAIRFVAWRSLKKLPGLESFDYDFVGTPEERQAAVERALAKWRETKPMPQPREAVLLDEHGELRAAAVKDLQGRRDERPVNIPE